MLKALCNSISVKLEKSTSACCINSLKLDHCPLPKCIFFFLLHHNTHIAIYPYYALTFVRCQSVLTSTSLSVCRAMTTLKAVFARPVSSAWWPSTLSSVRSSSPTWRSWRAARYNPCTHQLKVLCPSSHLSLSPLFVCFHLCCYLFAFALFPFHNRLFDLTYADPQGLLNTDLDSPN